MNQDIINYFAQLGGLKIIFATTIFSPLNTSKAFSI